MTILAAVDGEPGSERVARQANDLGAAYDEPVVVVHVLPESEYERRQGGARSFTLDRAGEEARTVAQSVVNAAFDGQPDRVRARGDVGDPDALLLDIASSVDASYLVVGSRKRSPVGKALFGSTTQALLLDAAQPVVTVPVDARYRDG